MRLRTFTVSLAVAAAATLPLAGVAMAQPPGDRDCVDFSSQEEAQEALLPGDPERLDANDNGVACESFDYDSGTPAAPTDPVDEEPADEEPAEEEPAQEEPAEEEPAVDDTDKDDTTDDDKDDTAPVDADDKDDDSDDGQVTVVPRGGVDTGDGSSRGEPAPFLIGGVLALGVAAAATRRRAHTAR